MKDGSDAIADWPILNALVNTAAGASWVSFHHGGGVGMGMSLHAGMVVVADGTPEAARAARAGAHERPGDGGHPPRRRGLRGGDRVRARRRACTCRTSLRDRRSRSEDSAFVWWGRAVPLLASLGASPRVAFGERLRFAKSRQGGSEVAEADPPAVGIAEVERCTPSPLRPRRRSSRAPAASAARRALDPRRRRAPSMPRCDRPARPPRRARASGPSPPASSHTLPRAVAPRDREDRGRRCRSARGA